MMFKRALASFALIAAWGVASFGGSHVAMLELGRNAGAQLSASNSAFYAYAAQNWLWSRFGLSASVLILILAAIWARPAWRAWSRIAMIACVACAAGSTQPAHAYYAKSDYAEPYIIMPNESAFWVPNIGDNKDTQQAFDSADYLNSKKIASKLFVVPHAHLSGSGSFFDYYVPSGRLYIVDRTPYSREWVSETSRGSSTRNEGFQCQSKEGLDINVGVTIATYVTEQNAAKFLYHYGVLPPKGDRADPNVIFTSVLYGRSLTDVMDANIRNAVQSLVCEELTSRTLTEDNEQAAPIMADIRAKIGTFLDGKGISLDFIGWADTFTFSKEVQAGIDRKFIAEQDQKIAQALAPYVGIIQQLAVAEALRTRWNGATPSSVSLTFLPQGLVDAAGKLLGGEAQTPVPAK